MQASNRFYPSFIFTLRCLFKLFLSRWSAYLTLAIIWLFSSSLHADWDQQGNFTFENRYFTSDDTYVPSFASEPQWYWSSKAGSTELAMRLFARYDDNDDERTHADIREFLITRTSGNWEFSAGVGKVFWGVTESNHLIDIINQTDLVESADGEQKLGQPMLKITTAQSWGNLDFFVLPYFRERLFPGQENPLAGPIAFTNDDSRFESGAEEKHVDVALYYNQFISYFDIGLSYFEGTNREPKAIPTVDVNGEAILLPFYDQISQTGISVQATIEAWLLKLESIYREDSLEAFSAVTVGFEYTFYAINDGPTDLGFLVEYNYDNRARATESSLQNDVFIGARFTPNDVQNTELLLGYAHDLDYDGSHLAFIEASRRLGDRFKVIVDARLFESKAIEDPLTFIENADYFSLTLEYYY